MAEFQSSGRLPSLANAISNAARNATIGGAGFAFATASGINLLFTDPRLATFLRRSDFELVVGLDAITDDRAVAALERLSTTYARLTVRLFVNPTRDCAFHPKLIWFGYPNGNLLVVTGSGNLTLGGLHKNWEAFSRANLSGTEAADFMTRWNAWLGDLGTSLRALNDIEALGLARQNRRAIVRARRVLAGPGVPSIERLIAAAAELAPAPSNLAEEANVLVTETPKNRSVSQLNVTADHYENYFGVPIGQTKRLLFIPVMSDGHEGVPESRPGVYAAPSRNYRFELSLGHGKAFPDPRRAIYLFSRLGRDRFRYMLLMPGDPGYDTMEAYLGNVRGNANQLKRPIITPSQLLQAWPETPLL